MCSGQAWVERGEERRGGGGGYVEGVFEMVLSSSRKMDQIGSRQRKPGVVNTTDSPSGGGARRDTRDKEGSLSPSCGDAAEGKA
ncbi:hypothetical protein Sjap_008191 [Stephania japonica]|uniref:Uncharacterized protein n=1 Tax=Stephania japonica TaxID=461633 RepID=A0AAP0JRD7_9MAGN